MSNKIDRSSWWFKLHKWNDTPEYARLREGNPVSLCPWFWRGLVLGLALVLVGVLVGVLALALLYSLVSGVSFLISPLTGYHGLSGHGVTICIGFPMFSLITGVTLVLEGSMEVWPNWIKSPLRKLFKPTSNTPKPPKSNIVTQYYKAHKEKWCPMLTLEDKGDK